MKKQITLLLAAVMAVSLCACGETKEVASVTTAAATTAPLSLKESMEPQGTETDSETAITLDEIAYVIEETLNGVDGMTGTVSKNDDGSGLIVIYSMDQVDMDSGDLIALYQDDSDAWSKVTASTVSIGDSVGDAAAAHGFGDIDVTTALVAKNNTGDILVLVRNGKIVFDCVTDGPFSSDDTSSEADPEEINRIDARSGPDEKENETSATQNPVQTQAQVSSEKRNALSKANSYLSSMSFSYSGLIDQLEYEKFSTEDATYAADNCGADWDAQALAQAKSYLDTAPFSHDGPD
ncbi:MAG: Ltp family lipoprotein [Oscillospiraceae bacterium]|nr:Ltp family lipoprotein [Oscillospiraceae bacterium]